MKIGIIGGTGWIGSALGRRLLGAGLLAPAELRIFNRSGPRADYFGHADVVWPGSAADLVAQSDVVVVSVRPEDWPHLGLQATGRLVISMMAKVDIPVLAACGGRIIRAMPNAAAEFGESYTPWFCAPDVTQADRAICRDLLAVIGASDELETEGHLDLMTALSGSGAAYPALMAMAMLDHARALGVPEAIARRAVDAAVCGGARLLSGRIEAAAEFVRLYTDYAGTTAAGLTAAQEYGFSTAITQALMAATRACRPVPDRQ